MSVLDFSRESALIICDMQEGYRHTVHHFSSVLATTLRMIRLAGLVGIQVFLTKGRPTIFGATVHEVEREIARLLPALFGGSFTKTKYFGHSEELSRLLVDQKFRHATVCGVEAHIGVRVQASELMDKGLMIDILLDGISSRNKEEIPPSISAMRDVANLNRFFIYFGTSETISYGIIDHQLKIGSLRVPVDDFLALILTESQSISSGLKNLLGNGDETISGDSSEVVE
ncbi:hypothetical protein FRC19_006089 [Serendipita sp. 401]|nr:hypothetical protein FRC15_011249 [Serendipita sp. 397]KAG8822388.1 hypothetical protein FRC19_006089 [Serendipita sp. 401]KAG8870826.1 hypothetical protein FRC20_011277 [Serendipita sp. 405]